MITARCKVFDQINVNEHKLYYVHVFSILSHIAFFTAHFGFVLIVHKRFSQASHGIISMKSGDFFDDDLRSLETLMTFDCESGLVSLRSPLMQCTTLELVHRLHR